MNNLGLPIFSGLVTPLKSTPFPTYIGDGKSTRAVLGFDHNLLQLSYYTEKSLRLVQLGPPLINQNPRTMLTLAQSDSIRVDSGWGLSLPKAENPRDGAVERGFIENRWPTWRKDLMETAHTLEKATTYVNDGRLIQAVVIKGDPGTLFNWRIGGKVQLGKRFLGKLDGIFDTLHSVETGEILSVTSNDLGYGVDIQLFINGNRQSLQPDNAAGLDRLVPDIRCHGQLNFDDGLMFLVAVFSFRDGLQSPKSKYRPEFPDILYHLGFEEPDKIEYRLPGRTGDIITRNVEQILSVSALSDPKQNEPRDIFLASDLVGHDDKNGVNINYEQTL